MAYENIYQRRRTAPPAQPAAVPQPNGQSFIEHQRRLHPPGIDASIGLNEAERRQVKEIQRLISSGLWGVGNIIPNKLMAAVFDNAPPAGHPFSLEAASDPAGRIARQINAGSPGRGLATDQAPRPRNDLATDGPQHRPTMSYELSRVLGDWDYMSEDDFDASMKNLDIHDITRRIALKQEALACGVMRAKGTRNTHQRPPARYIPARHIMNPKDQHFIDKNSPAATKDTGGRNDTPGRKHVPGTVPHMRASTADGYAAYSGTGIELL